MNKSNAHLWSAWFLGVTQKYELRVSFKKILMMFLDVEMPSIYQIIWKQEKKKELDLESKKDWKKRKKKA